MKPNTFVCILMTVGLCGIVVHGGNAESQDTQTAAGDEQIRTLLVERRDTLQQILDIVTATARTGRVAAEELIRAENAVLDADLLLAKTKAERIVIYERRLENARLLEAKTNAQYEAKRALAAEPLAAKAARLQAETELMQEQSR